MNLKRYLVAALAAVALHANAFVGNYPEGSFTYNSGKQFVVADVFNFQLSAPSTLQTTLEITKSSGILGLGLFDADDNSYLGGLLFGGSAGTTATQSFANLSSGNYYYGVLGGFFPKGSYSLQSAATAVPEPAALVLALMGVGGLAVAARRKRKSSNAVG
jgi:hypothetical protein